MGRDVLSFSKMAQSSPDHSELARARQRWALVNARSDKSAREATLEDKLDEVERLMQSIDDFGWRAALDDDACVRERWNRLRTKLGPLHVEAKA